MTTIFHVIQAEYAAITRDADVLVPRRLSSTVRVDIHALMEENGFVAETDYSSGFHRFIHPDLNFEFLTDGGGAKSMDRLKEIYAGFPKGWKKKVDAGLKEAEPSVPLHRRTPGGTMGP